MVAPGGGGVKMVNVLIFSPIRLFCDGLVACLQAWSDEVSVLGALSSADHVRDAIGKQCPHLLLYDVTLRESLVEAHRIIEQWPALPVIAVALPEEPMDVVRCAEAGFVGYVPAHSSIDDLIAIIRASVAGELVCSPRVAAELMRQVRRRPPPSNPALEPLTSREREVLVLITRGLCNKEIARDLQISVATVKNHVHNAFAKLNVSHRSGVIGLLRSDPSLISVPSP